MGSIRNGGPHSFVCGVNDTGGQTYLDSSNKCRAQRGSADAIRKNMRPHKSHPLDAMDTYPACSHSKCSDLFPSLNLVYPTWLPVQDASAIQDMVPVR